MRKVILKESTDTDLQRFNVKKALFNSEITASSIPSNFSMRDSMTPVRSQGDLGSCASFAVLSCLEHIHKRDLSEAQVQHESEKKYDDCKEGLKIVNAFETCKSQGAVDETVWPYDDTQVCFDTPPNTDGEAFA